MVDPVTAVLAINGTLKAINAASALVTLAINSLTAAQRYNDLVSTARAEGREVSDEELAKLQTENVELTEETLALLKVPAAE